MEHLLLSYPSMETQEPDVRSAALKILSTLVENNGGPCARAEFGPIVAAHFTRLLRRGEITRVGRGKKSTFKITEVGRQKHNILETHPQAYKNGTVPNPASVSALLAAATNPNVLTAEDRKIELSRLSKRAIKESDRINAMKALEAIEEVHAHERSGPPPPATPEEITHRLSLLMKAVGKEITAAAFQVAFINGIPYQEPDDLDDDDAIQELSEGRRLKAPHPPAETVPHSPKEAT